MSKFKIIFITFCILVAYSLPLSMAKNTESGIITPKAKPVKALQTVSLSHKDEVAEIVVKAVITPPSGSNVFNGSGDYYLDWIISHESGGNPYAMNSIGACGLGQSLPCSKVLGACGSLDNVQCQIDWVRNYCISRYGSTLAAYDFWQVHNWY